ncbi:MAG: hypothetical protein ACPKM0_10600 [Pleomorphochaeta sp.]
MKKIKALLLGLIVLFSCSFLSANTLETLVNNSIDKSDQITNLKLNRDYTLLTVEASELDSKTVVTIAPKIYTTSFDEYVLETNSSSLVSVVIPGDYVPTTSSGVSDTTTILADTTLTYDVSGNDFDMSLSSLNVSHNFLLGDYTNNQRNLNNQLTLLSANQAYETGIVNYKKNVYSYVSNIISNEKSQKDVKKNFEDQEKIINDSLKLKQITKDSITYKQYSLLLNSYKDSLENLEIQKESLLKNFKDYTGIDYEEVNDIREPVLDIDSSIDESLTIQIAQLNVRIKQDTIDQVEREKTQSYINLNTAIADYGVYDTSEDMSIGVLATYNANNLSFNAGTNFDYTLGSSASFTPAVQVGATWTNDTTSESDIIENKLNENALISSQLDLNSAIQSKELTKLTLNTQIVNWKSQYKQLLDNIQYQQDTLKLKKEMFDLGLVSESDVTDVEFEIEQLNYDMLTLLIDGLTIELDIEKLNL